MSVKKPSYVSIRKWFILSCVFLTLLTTVINSKGSFWQIKNFFGLFYGGLFLIPATVILNSIDGVSYFKQKPRVFPFLLFTICAIFWFGICCYLTYFFLLPSTSASVDNILLFTGFGFIISLFLGYGGLCFVVLLWLVFKVFGVIGCSPVGADASQN